LIHLPGDYSQAKVVLANNKLTRFEEGVFKEILTAMTYSSGTLDVRGSKKNMNKINVKTILFLIYF